jgi:hypothetical protein
MIMKKQVKILFIAAVLGTAMWSCTKIGSSNLSLKQSVDAAAVDLNSAMNTITASKAYTILTVNDGMAKSADATAADYKVYITLDTVKGVYNYKPIQKHDRWNWSLMRFFEKTADDSKMIVKMPLAKVEHPRSLRNFQPSDTLLTNNFTISVSDYHNNYNSYHDFDYLLKSEISIDDKVAGNLNIDYMKSPVSGTQYASQYAFTDSYTADYKYVSGDTTISSFGISKGGTVLYEEKRLTIKNDTLKFGREHQYILTIGDVQIVRSHGLKDAKVYLKGVLQENAVVEVVDNDSDLEGSVCKKRDVKITFDDGTSTTIKTLIGESVDNIKTLFDSLHDVYFAAYVVDWIAYDIYYKRN